VEAVSGELVPWLRAEITGRLEVARQACPRTDGHWWRREDDHGGVREPVSHLYAGERIADEDGETWGGEFIVVYDEGAPSEGQFEHIGRNDPRDTMARCEFELALLDEHSFIRVGYRDSAGIDRHSYECAACDPGGPPDSYPCRTVRLLGYGYRYRDGYREAEWK
jgi:hypothetical protein